MGTLGDAEDDAFRWEHFVHPPFCGRPAAFKMAREMPPLPEEDLPRGDGGEDSDKGGDHQDGPGSRVLGT